MWEGRGWVPVAEEDDMGRADWGQNVKGLSWSWS